MEEFKAITDEFFKIQIRIGTLEHEVALDALKKQVSLCGEDIRTGVLAMIREFRTMRRKASKLQKEEQQNRVKRKSSLEDLERLIAELETEGDPIFNSSKSALSLLRQADELDVDFAPVWKKTSWVMLRIHLALANNFLRYLFARIKVLLTFHGFIFIVPIAILGIGYSFATKALTELLFGNVQGLSGTAIALLVLTYAFKKYYVDKKLKRYQISLEKQLYQPLSSRLMVARTVALQFRVRHDGRGADADLVA